jgi:putative tryptophan/tyrosine transport system substrate-binding protein
MKVVSSQWSVVSKNVFCLALCALLFAVSIPAEAQQAGKIFRIGFLDNGGASGNAPLLDAFRQEMRKLGWIEGKNFTFEYRFAEGKFDRLPDLAADLVRLKVDLIMVSGGSRRWRPRAPLRLSPL